MNGNSRIDFPWIPVIIKKTTVDIERIVQARKTYGNSVGAGWRSADDQYSLKTSLE